MKRGLTGHYVPLPSAAGEKARAFVPNPLPVTPPLELDAEVGVIRQESHLSAEVPDYLLQIVARTKL